MTEKEADLLFDIQEEFWEEFSRLCWKHINRAPEHLRDELRMRLGDKTSIYGIADDEAGK